MSHLTLAQVSDRIELERLVVDYAHAIDERAFDRLDRVFMPDAYIDYRAMGGIDGRYPAIKAWLPQALAHFPAYMHLVGNCAFDVQGGKATGRIACINPMVLPATDGKTDTMFLGLWYQDRYVRTPQGWRISERIEQRGFDFNMPEAMKRALKLG